MSGVEFLVVVPGLGLHGRECADQVKSFRAERRAGEVVRQLFESGELLRHTGRRKNGFTPLNSLSKTLADFDVTKKESYCR